MSNQMIKSFLIIAITLLSANAVKAANESSRVAQAIQSANTVDLVSMFNSSIELLTPSSSGISTKEQAKIVLDNFFRNNTPVKATVTHETSGTTNTMFVISLTTKSGTFRISVVGSLKGGTFLINEFKIV
jgi:hypothetical protein